jgi:hypothetical protein
MLEPTWLIVKNSSSEHLSMSESFDDLYDTLPDEWNNYNLISLLSFSTNIKSGWSPNVHINVNHD